MQLELGKQPNDIIFSTTRDGSMVWVMRITDKGIIFNRDEFNDASADDFAKLVIEILERNFDVKFLRKNHLQIGENESETK